MWPPYYAFVRPLPVATLEVYKSRNRQQRRKLYFGKGNKKLRDWDGYIQPRAQRTKVI